MNTGAKICIDPGHGGVDPGAIGNHVKEADLNLLYGLEFAAILVRAGASVALTRKTAALPGSLMNKDDALMLRCKIANEFGAACFVSLHFNSSDDPDAKGFQVFYAKGSFKGEALAHSVNRSVTGGEPFGKVYPDESPQDGNRRLAVLRHTRMPAILIEFGFVSNLDDVRAAQDPVKRHVVLTKVMSGIDAWLKTQKVAG